MMSETASQRLILVTPAHNEADHVPTLIKSIVGQTTRPDHWVIYDDGSDDGTGQIATDLARDHDFITVVQHRRQAGRQLSSKATAVAAAYEVARREVPDAAFVASMDADVELPPHTFSFLLDRFADDAALGVAGGIYIHDVGGGELRAGQTRPHHVPGPLQVFRREVFDAIGGYRPLPDGGLDVVSTAHARMLGWRTEAFHELRYNHHRQMGTGGGRKPLAAHFHGGIRDRSLGAGALFMMAKCLRRLGDRPLVLAAAARLAGFAYSFATRRPSAIPPDLQRFIRNEQRERFKPPALRTATTPTYPPATSGERP